MFRGAVRWLGFLGATVGAIGCGDDTSSTNNTPATGGSGSGGAPTGDVTFYADVKPILDARCVSCHQPGQIGIGNFLDVDEIVARGGQILQQVQDGIMPPWLAGPDCNSYMHDPTLPDEQVATLAAWVEAGMPVGDPADDPQVSPPEPVELSRVDHTIEMPVDYLPKPQSPDDYRCFIVDWPGTETEFVTGFGVRPGNASTVHHVIAFVAPPEQVALYEDLDEAEPGPGYTCYGGPGGPLDGSTPFFGAWAPGTQDIDFGMETGVRMDPGSKVIIQVHYNTLTWDGQPDRTRVLTKVESSVGVEGRYQFYASPAWLGGGMPIPAGEADVSHEFSFDPTSFFFGGQPFKIWLAMLHMHTRGTSARLDIERGGGDNTCVLDVPRWDFDWQFGYRLNEPVRFEPGDALRIGCHWDNSAANQPVVDGVPAPPMDLAWGDGTGDEMCLGVLYITPDG